MRAVVGIACAIAFGCGTSPRLTDDGGTGPFPDTLSNAGEFGEPCTMHTDCKTGYCVEPAGGAGGVCSRTCDGDCPAGYDCLSVTFPNAPVQLCVPSTA